MTLPIPPDPDATPATRPTPPATPLPAATPVPPALAATAPMPGTTPMPPAARMSTATAAPPARGQRNIVLIVIAVIAVVFLLSRLFPRENRYERLASQVTVAIVNNDMRPVEKDFNAIRRPELRDRARVGHLSDLVAPLGKFKGSKETAPPPNSPDGYHQFIERFDKGTLLEKYQLDGDGKIVKFHIGPNGAG